MITFSLPYPPSVNHYWGQRGKRRFIKPRGVKFLADVKAIAFTQRIPKQTGRLTVTAVLYPPDLRTRDLDNALKGFFDGMVKSGIIPDDSSKYVRRLVVEWGPKVKDGRMDVMIEPYRPRLQQIQKGFLNN